MTTRSVWSAGLLVAGTSIGGGMLALPVATSEAGFLPALLLYAASAFIMAVTALLMAEVVFALEGEPNMVSMARETLGKWGTIVVPILYLFLFYSLLVAYYSGLTGLFCNIANSECTTNGAFVVAAIVFLVAVARVSRIEMINNLFMMGMGGSFLLFLALGFMEVEVDHLLDVEWSAWPLAFPITFTAFAFQGVVPTVVRVLERDRKAVTQAILIGVSLPLTVYIVWHILVAGTTGLDNLRLARSVGETAVAPLSRQLESPIVREAGSAFGFFALVTSLIGVTLGLRDFFLDGLSLKRGGIGRIIAALFTSLPPLFIVISYPSLFLSALELAGGVGCALLLGLLPILMASKVRRDPTAPKLVTTGWKGKLIIGIVTLLIFVELACQAM